MWMLVSDIDGTLVGDQESLLVLSEKIAQERKNRAMFFVLCTGRHLEQVIEGFEKEGLPMADAIMCQVGTEIYFPPYTEHSQPYQEWSDLLSNCFTRNEAIQFLEGIEGLVMQPEEFNTRFKVSCYLDRCPNPELAAVKIQERIHRSGKSYLPVWSSGRDFDILPSVAGKGNASNFIAQHQGINPADVIVAGDTGNDLAMFTAPFRGIAVGNAKVELKTFITTQNNEQFYQADKNFAAGVQQGLDHFHAWRGQTSASHL